MAYSDVPFCSGGLYYASAVLAPSGWGPIASWVTGWSSWIGQVTGAPSVNYSVAAMILAARSITDSDYVPTNYELFSLPLSSWSSKVASAACQPSGSPPSILWGPVSTW
jgi:hypothetical protein